MDTPNSHHGILRPERKYSDEDLPARRETHRPTNNETAKKTVIMIQSTDKRDMGVNGAF
jgi:hypothetical protein